MHSFIHSRPYGLRPKLRQASGEEARIDHLAAPVFFDASGKRWKRIMVGIVLTMLALVGTAAWIGPEALEPTWTPTQNQGSDYPRELLASGDDTNIPLLGLETGFAFVRIALVESRGGAVYLKDPFSDTIFRKATKNEVDLIGQHPYVMERFGGPEDHQLMLTFDDGPSPRFTRQILDILAREDVPATFFAVGENVVQNPDLFLRTVREGHMAGNHTMSHIDFYAHGDLRNRGELIATNRVMRASAGYASRLFRIPGGDPDNNPLAVLQAQQLGYVYVDMNLDTRDWSYAPGEKIPVPTLNGSGNVVLMHDAGGDRSATIEMLEKLIAEAKDKGYSFSTLQPMLPEQYQPVRTLEASVADHATLAAFTFLMVAPATLITWLFWFGIGSLTIMSVLYVVLAVVGHRRQVKKRWQHVGGDQLPLVSVILPVFNEEPVVAKTLTALKSSDYPALEVIAIDDGSTDNTLTILETFAGDWSQLRVLSQANAGKSAASNFGLSSARGDIVVTLDGDTLFEPQTVRMLVRHFNATDAAKGGAKRRGKSVGAVAGHVKVGNRRNLLTAWQSLEYISGICVTRMAEGLVGAISIVPGACAAWRKEALIQAGGYSHETMAEDADLTLCIQRLGYRIVQENKAVAWTEAPMTVRGLAKQRLRWTYGNLQSLYKHRSMILRPKYGALGLVALPYALLATLVPLLFMPLTVIVAAISLAAGQWESIAAFGAFVAVTHMVISIVAVVMVREKAWHLLMVPIYRLIYEPLRAYLLYASLMQALKGRSVGWYKPERTNSVVEPVSTTATGSAPAPGSASAPAAVGIPRPI